MEDLRRLHGQLERTVQQAEKVFSALQLHGTRSPQRADLVEVFAQTRAIATALADFLDGLDCELGNEGSGVFGMRSPPDQVRAFLLEVEPPPPPRQGFHPGAPRRTSALGKLPLFYGYHSRLHNELYRNRVQRSFAWEQSVQLWQSFVYFGGITASGGLLSRLDFISEVRELRREPRWGKGTTVSQNADGRSMMSKGPFPATQSYPWDRHDIDELRHLAARAGFFATATDEAVLEDHRRCWCRLIDDWLRAGPDNISRGSFLIASVIDDAPAADGAVRERLEKLAALEPLGEEARAKARAKLGSG